MRGKIGDFKIFFFKPYFFSTVHKQSLERHVKVRVSSTKILAEFARLSFLQCSGSCFFTYPGEEFVVFLFYSVPEDPGPVPFWALDPGLGKKSGSGMNNPGHISESFETNFWVKVLQFFLQFFDADPGWKKLGSRIRDGTNGCLSRIRNAAFLFYLCNLLLRLLNYFDSSYANPDPEFYSMQVLIRHHSKSWIFTLIFLIRHISSFVEGEKIDFNDILRNIINHTFCIEAFLSSCFNLRVR